MDRPDHHDAEQGYRDFLRSRWPVRAGRLATYAFFGSAVLAFFDAAYTRAAGAPAPLADIAAVRLPWIAIPIAAWVVIRVAPAWRFLPALASALSVSWTWGNTWGYFALDLAGTPLQATALPIFFITAATFLPLGTLGRAGVFAAMALGQVALDVAWPAPALALRLWADAALVTVALALVAVFESFAASQRRGVELRQRLEATVVALEASRERATAAAQAVGKLAAEVAHQVNNPLSAVKVNVRWLAEAALDEGNAVERAEVVADTLDAVQRIARIVAGLERQAPAHDPDAGPGPASTPPAAGG